MRKLIFILIALISFSQAQTIQYIGAPTTTVISRGNFRTDSIFYLPKRTKTPTDTAAFRYQISDSSLYYWTGYQWMKVGNNQDTASMLSNYVRGSGTTNYFSKFNSTRSIVDSKLYESNLNLLFNSTTPYLTTSGISTIENNGTSAALYVLKTLDTARAYVSFGGANTMDINNLRAGDIRFYTNATLRGRFQTDGTFRLNSLTGTGSRIVVADDNGVLSATSSATGLVDTTVISTRAYRQKGDDSLGAIIATKGSGTVTSVATGYGLSGGTITTTGTLIADTLNLSTRAWRQKGLDSLAALEISGSGTTNYVPKFTASRTIGNSLIFDEGTNVGINTTSPGARLDVFSSGYNFIRSTGGNGGYFESYNSVGTRLASYGAESNGDAYFGTRGNNPSYLISNGLIRLTATGAGEILINTTTDAGAYTLQNNGALYNTGSTVLAATSGAVTINKITANSFAKLDVDGNVYVSDGSFYALRNSLSTLANYGIHYSGTSPRFPIRIVGDPDPVTQRFVEFGFYKDRNKDSTWNPKFMINFFNAETFINTTSDAGDYKLQVDGNIYNTGSSVFNATSGESYFGTTTDAGNYRVQVSGNSYLNGDIYVNTTTGFNTLFTQSLGGGGIGMVSTIDPTASGNRLFSLAFGSVNYPANARIEAYASEAWSSTARGTYITFRTTPNGSTGVQDRFYIGNDGIVSVNNLTPSSSAQFEVFSTTRGFLPPRMTTAQRDAISSPAAGLVIYNTTTSKLQVYTTSWTDLH